MVIHQFSKQTDKKQTNCILYWRTLSKRCAIWGSHVQIFSVGPLSLQEHLEQGGLSCLGW